MDKETKIDMLLSLLAKVMYQGSLPAASSDPTVVFLSSSEVQLIESSGCIPVNKYYDSVPLYELIRKVVDYLYEDEEKHWYETILSSSDVPEDNMDYNHELCPEHIFHSIRKLKELISI